MDTAVRLGSHQSEGRTASLLNVLTSKNRSTWDNPSYWRKLCSDLTISDQVVSGRNEDVDDVESQRRRERLVEDGYVLVDDDTRADEQSHATLVQKLADSIIMLHKSHSFPATFILLFDQTWQLARAASRVLSSSTDPANNFNFDCLAWYIDPCEGVSGFSPHRDRQPEPPVSAKETFHKNGMAQYVTMWLALTDATPENSCLYVIPRQFDPGYMDGDDNGIDDEGVDDKGDDRAWQGLDPLSRALSTKQSYQNIRALPRLAGQSVLFTHRILHWGSKGNPNSHLNKPRIAISFVSSDPKFEKPYIDASLEESIPPFRIRLLLVCAQLLIYYQRFDLPKECIKACYDYCKEHGSALEESYRKKVFCEFVKAMSEDEDEPDKAAPMPRHDKTVVGDNSDDEDDAVLEEMLDAEAGGYGEFQDDFDELENEHAEGEEGAASDDEQFDQVDDPGLLFRKRDPDEEVEQGSAKKKRDD